MRRSWKVLLGIVSLALCGFALGADHWDDKPLGPKVEIGPLQPAPIKQPLRPTLKVHAASGPGVVLVEDGRPACVLMVADEATRAAREGAAFLADGLKKMSGAKVPIVKESELALAVQGNQWSIRHQGQSIPYLVAIGDTKLSASQGLSGEDLPLEGYRIKTVGNVLLLMGSDLRADCDKPLQGSRHAAVALLERHLGFRWLWPGELGEVVPRNSTVKIPPLDEEDAPAIRGRTLRWWGSRERMAVGVKALGLRMEGCDEIFSQAGPWFERQRQGVSHNFRKGEAYGNWWNRFGQEHPDWFALQRNGSRTQVPERNRLCVSNPGLVQQVIAEKLAEVKRYPDADSVSVVPEDGGFGNSYCLCENCRKLDPVNGAPIYLHTFSNNKLVTPKVAYVSLSDRYFTFFNQVAEGVAKVYPDKPVATLAYSFYSYPPLTVRPHPNLIVSFVGMQYWSDHRVNKWGDPGLEVDRERWERWAALARTLRLRPNAFHEGLGMPGVFVTKLGRDFKHCYETGMIGADYDSALHDWATQGLNYYVLVKLMWDPSQAIEAIVGDYCERGFGKAATQVREYFRKLEELNARIAAAPDPDPNGEKSLFRDYQLVIRFFTPEVTAGLRQTLAAARAAAGDDATVQERIAFLEAGLRYAEVQHGVYMASPEDKATMHRVLDERYAAFREIFEKHPFSVNVTYITWRESGMWAQTGWKPPAADRQ